MPQEIERDEKFLKFSQLMWDNKTRLQADLSKDKKSIKLWLGDEGYLPEAVFNAWFSVAAKMASKDEHGKSIPANEAILIFVQVKAEILSMIIAINFIAEDN